MSNEKNLPQQLLDRIAKVRKRRARLVLDHIAEKGMITTEELQAAGYSHPPRARQDAKDLGFHLKTIRVKHSNGRSIAAYEFDEGELDPSKTGRRPLPKKERDALIKASGSKCQICGARHNLQVDHRIPYEVAGESQYNEAEPYQILDGSCNRKKSWSCEHCENWTTLKNLDTCQSCYWANPLHYSHVAMQQERRIDLVWIGDEVSGFDALKREANKNRKSVSEQIKDMIAARTTQRR